MLTIRLETQLKERLEQAARSRGQSLSAFVLEAATARASRTQSGEAGTGGLHARVHGGVPSFFRALCDTAAAGGGHNYESVGFRFAGAIDQLSPDDEDDWHTHTRALGPLCADDNVDGIVEWFAETFPDAIRLVPARRRESFARGVIRRWREYDTDWAVRKAR